MQQTPMTNQRIFRLVLGIVAGAVLVPAGGEDQLTIYELLAPATHKFAITYDVSQPAEGARYFFNPIRIGSIASDEKVLDLATGKDLKFEVVDAKKAQAAGMRARNVPEGQEYLQVHLAAPVPKGGMARIRIIKTYEDAASYKMDGDKIVWERGLGIRRNVVVLPPGYEVTACSVPTMVSTQPDGRVRLSFLNDRDDQLPVKIVARKGGA
ncbi:MAG: hypothetical protein ABI823_12930 [Bryobacteraceae bacterium]